jgi:CRISPR-associated protein Csm1
MDQCEYRTLILAGLLHDIGKLLNKPKPEKGKKHAHYGDEFLGNEEIASLFGERFGDVVDHQALRDLVLFHDPYVKDGRKPTVRDDLLRIIRRADGYSAGERALSTLYGRPPTGDLALDTIFDRRYLGRPLAGVRPQYKPAILSPEAAFPQERVEPLTEEDYQGLQHEFRSSYRHALSRARNWDELEAWTYSLLERYTWAVPSALQKDPRDVSLFDHARTSCALAAALYLRQGAQKGDREQRLFLLIKGDISGVQDYIYSVANVGPGGVAKRLRARSFFITALTEVVGHRLREELVEGYRLPIATTIFAGGGQFVLLVPNLKSLKANLARIEREVNDWLWSEFQGDLAVVFGVEEVGGSEMAIRLRERGRNICQVLADLDHKVAAAKRQRLASLLQAGGRWKRDAFLWKPEGKDYEHGACPSCDRLPARASGEELSIDERLCHHCLRDRMVSEQIVEAHYVGYWRDQLPDRADPAWLHRRRLTFFDQEIWRHAILFSNLDEIARLDPPPYQLDGFGYHPPVRRDPETVPPPLVRHFANHVPRWTDPEILQTFCTQERACVQGSSDDNETCGIKLRPDGSVVSLQDYPILQTFGCLSAAAAEWEDGEGKLRLGAQLLGVLRADVDHLGLLFSESFEEEVRLSKKEEPEKRPVRSLSRLATLSRMTDLFFSGWVNHALSKPPYDRIYTVYSGGDDLCLVGPWDTIVRFAHHLAAEFERYVADNPNVTLSAAIAVTKPKFPIATSAKLAGRWLKERAKDRGRNRLHLFGVTVRWRDLPDWENTRAELRKELEELERHAELLWADLWPWAELLDEELHKWREAETVRYPVSTGFAHRLLHYAERAREWEQEERISADDMLYLARLAYDLGRNVVKSDAVSERTKRRLSTLTQLTNREVMAGMRLPITYALYRNRERSRE